MLKEWLTDERRKLADLKPWPNNPRVHSDEQIAQIAANWKDAGQTMRLLIDESNVILAGHGRRLAAISLGLEEVDVRVAHGWSETKKRNQVLWDNRSALLSTWDTDLLHGEVKLLNDAGSDLRLTGFSTMELDQMLTLPGEGNGGAPGSEVDPYALLVDFSFGDYRARVSRPIYDKFAARFEAAKKKGAATLDDFILRVIK